MRPLVIALVVIAGCAPAGPTPAASTALPAPTGIVSAPNEHVVDPSPSPVAVPIAPPAPPPVIVTVDGATFPTVNTFALQLAPLPQSEEPARHGVAMYLESLDRYRDGGFDDTQLSISGPFREAVVAGLKASAMPGVKRRFELESLQILRRYVKPWGTQAFLEARVTIVDRAVDGVAAPQRETGVLRLAGDGRVGVVDGWDGARWFNASAGVVPGLSMATPEIVRQEIVHPLSFYLGFETWVPGSAPVQWRTTPEEATPFGTRRAARVAAIDRTVITTRAFDDVVAHIERFETFPDWGSGLATARLSGTVVTTDANGRVSRVGFERRVRVFMFGNWMPEVVDEEISGEWAAGGQLALERIDVNRG